MNSHGIEVFNRANEDALILEIAHDLHFVLLPSQQALFDKNLPHRRGIQTLADHFVEFLSIVGNSATRTTKSERRPNDKGEVSHFLKAGLRLFQSINSYGFCHIETNFDHGLLE